MRSLYSHLKQPVSDTFPNDIWVGVIIKPFGPWIASNMRKVKQSDNLINVHKWTIGEVRVQQANQ